MSLQPTPNEQPSPLQEQDLARTHLENLGNHREELRPCPFCGESWQKPSVMSLRDDSPDGGVIGDPHSVYHNQCGTLGPVGKKSRSLCINQSCKERWNSAWCWKEIDRLKDEHHEYELRQNAWYQKELDRLKEANEKLHIEASKGLYTPMKQQNEKMRKALEYLRDYYAGTPTACISMEALKEGE